MKYWVTASVLALGESAAWAAGAFIQQQAARRPPLEEPISLLSMAAVSAGMLLTIAIRCHPPPPRPVLGRR